MKPIILFFAVAFSLFAFGEEPKMIRLEDVKVAECKEWNKGVKVSFPGADFHVDCDGEKWVIVPIIPKKEPVKLLDGCDPFCNGHSDNIHGIVTLKNCGCDYESLGEIVLVAPVGIPPEKLKIVNGYVDNSNFFRADNDKSIIYDPFPNTQQRVVEIK